MPSLHFNALCIEQPSGRKVFSFAARASDLLKIADIPHMKRGEENALEGYQRPEVAAHIAEIRRYLNSSDALLPNTIVVAFGEGVHIEPNHQEGDAPTSDSPAEYVRLAVPYDSENKLGFVVDGQQRLAAASSSDHEDFPLFVTAFIAPDVAEQRKQFMLVNRTKPLPQGMVFELLAEMKGHLPQQLARQRLSSALTMRLNLTQGVLHGKIHTPTIPGGVIKDNSMRRAISTSLSDGALYYLVDKEGERWKDEEELKDAMQHLLSTFWEAVAKTFPVAWDLPPKSSRLTHGVGIISLGYVMDHLFARKLAAEQWDVEHIAAELKAIEPYCAWTSGTWRFGSDEVRAWNALQNIDRDIRHLTKHLCGFIED